MRQTQMGQVQGQIIAYLRSLPVAPDVATLTESIALPKEDVAAALADMVEKGSVRMVRGFVYRRDGWVFGLTAI